jgi:hypothetical protein
VLGLLANVGMHAVPPEVGNILVRQQLFVGSRTRESMRKQPIPDQPYAPR